MSSFIHSLAKPPVVSRILAWIILLLSLGWFYLSSPKTPLDFFDAACRDSSVAEARAAALLREKAPETPPVEDLDVEMERLMREMGRIALEYDLSADPQNVRKERSSVVFGYYSPGEATRGVLLRENARFAELYATMESLKQRMKDPGVRDQRKKLNKLKKELKKGEDSRFLRIVIDGIAGMHARGTLARIFWPDHS